MTSAKITFNEETDSFACSFPGIEYSGKAVPMQLSINASGICYAGVDKGRDVSRWKEIENPGSVEEIAYKFAGPDFDISWKLKNGLVTSINVESTAGGIQPIPRLD